MTALCFITLSWALTLSSTLLNYAYHCFWLLVLLQKGNSKEHWHDLNYSTLTILVTYDNSKLSS